MEMKVSLCKNCANLRPELVSREFKDCLAYPKSRNWVTGKQEFRMCREVRRNTETNPICTKFKPASIWNRLRTLI